MITLWLALALLAIGLYGSSQVAQKFALNSLTAPNMIFLSIVQLPIYFVCLAPFLVTGLIWSLQLAAFVLGLVAATFGQLGYYAYVEAAERGPISIVGSVTAAYPVMVIVVAILFFRESPTVTQLGGALLITCSIIALSYVHGEAEKKRPATRSFLFICIVSLLLWGMWAIFTKMTLDRIHPLLFLGIYGLIIPPTAVGYYKLKRLGIRESIPRWSVPLIIAITATMVANIAFFAEINAVSLGPASVVFPLVASSPLVVVLLAYSFLKERLSWIEWAFVALVIVGIVMVSTA